MGCSKFARNGFLSLPKPFRIDAQAVWRRIDTIMHESGEPNRPGRYRVLSTPSEPRVACLAWGVAPSPFFFCWGGPGKAEPIGVLSHPDFGSASGVRRALSAGRRQNQWVRAAIAEANLDSDDDDDDSTLSVCRTSLYDRSRRESDPGRFIDTTLTPYLTLGTRRTFGQTGVGLGDLVTVVHPGSGRYCHAIVGDAREVVGVEPSLCLVDILGLNSGEPVIYLVYPESGAGQGTIPSGEQISREGEHRFRGTDLAMGPDCGWEAILRDYFATLLDADTNLQECGRDVETRALRA